MLTKEHYLFLQKKSQGLYRKAINLYGNSYGIGCMVYLRRIVEEEVLSILKQLLDPSAVQELEMIELENTGIEKRKVYEYASRLIPETLKVFGNNPILRLWDISSTAIHSKTDEEAMEMCHDMILLLDFLVDRLEFEKTETKNIKKILKD